MRLIQVKRESSGTRLRGRILFMVTSHVSLTFVSGLADYLQERGWDVHVSSSPVEQADVGMARGRYLSHSVPMAREIALREDMRSIFLVLQLIRRLRPAIVIAGTPKAAVLGMIASLILRVPRRVYVMHGLRLEGERGLKRRLLTVVEWATCSCATEIIAVSHSLALRAISLRVCAPHRINVLGAGSANGVDVEHFRSTYERHLTRVAPTSGIPRQLGGTLGYVGRIHPDKGLDLLAGSLRILAEQGIRGKLVVVGGDDGPESPDLRAGLNASGWEVRHVGYVEDVRGLYESMDILCFPTRREGFGNVVIEAAACGVPTVATLATGVSDAVVDGVTGRVVLGRAPGDFAQALSSLLLNDGLRTDMAVAGRRRVELHFDQRVVWSRWEEFLLSS